MRTGRTILILILCLACAGPAYAFRRRGDGELVTAKIQEAKILMADEKYDDALIVLKKVIKEFPRNQRTEIALATINHIYQIIGFMNEAYDYFVMVEKKYKRYQISLVAVYMYIPILIKREQYEEAITKCREVHDKDPTSYWAIGSLFNIASMYCQRLDQEEEGIAMYRRIIKEYPNTQFAKIARMEIAMRKKNE